MNHTEKSYDYFISQLTNEEKFEARMNAEYHKKILIEGLSDELPNPQKH